MKEGKESIGSDSAVNCMGHATGHQDWLWPDDTCVEEVDKLLLSLGYQLTTMDWSCAPVGAIVYFFLAPNHPMYKQLTSSLEDHNIDASLNGDKNSCRPVPYGKTLVTHFVSKTKQGWESKSGHAPVQMITDPAVLEQRYGNISPVFSKGPA